MINEIELVLLVKAEATLASLRTLTSLTIGKVEVVEGDRDVKRPWVAPRFHQPCAITLMCVVRHDPIMAFVAAIGAPAYLFALEIKKSMP